MQTPCQVLVVTEGRCTRQWRGLEVLPGIKLHVCLIGNDNDIKDAEPLRVLVAKTSGSFLPLTVDQLSTPEHAVAQAEECIAKLTRLHFSPYKGQIMFGKLTSPVRLYPSPLAFLSNKQSLPTELSIVGFIKLSVVGSPPVLSRHVVLPPHTLNDLLPVAEPDFRVLLHDALRQEETAAVVGLASNWFALLYSWAERKKVNMMLSVLWPGRFLPWVGELVTSHRALALRRTASHLSYDSNRYSTPIVKKRPGWALLIFICFFDSVDKQPFPTFSLELQSLLEELTNLLQDIHMPTKRKVRSSCYGGKQD